jgi:hypothetical protein
MGVRHPGRLAGKARAIITDRDYFAVRGLLAVACEGALVQAHAERLEALLRELVAYEDRIERTLCDEPRDQPVSIDAAKRHDWHPCRRWYDC